MAYVAAEARQDLLDTVAGAADELGVALAYLGEAYEQLDEHSADRLEEELFRPVQAAYGRAKRVHAGFADRHGLPARDFASQSPSVRPHDAKGAIERGVSAAAQADGELSALQDSMRPVEVGDQALRDGLSEVRRLLAGVPGRARELVRVLGR